MLDLASAPFPGASPCEADVFYASLWRLSMNNGNMNKQARVFASLSVLKLRSGADHALSRLPTQIKAFLTLDFGVPVDTGVGLETNAPGWEKEDPKSF